MENLDPKDPLDSVEKMDSVDHLVQMASLDLLDQEENLDHKVHKDKPVCRIAIICKTCRCYVVLVKVVSTDQLD